MLSLGITFYGCSADAGDEAPSPQDNPSAAMWRVSFDANGGTGDNCKR
ncbi:MAG: hypothetical protein II821_09665 [Treponema sp.]|nr:hypothetical protein [Treponema sp.]